MLLLGQGTGNKYKFRRRGIFFCFCLEVLPAEGYSATFGQGQFCFYCTNPHRFFMFLLLLISTHEMRRLMLMVNDVNSFTDISHQHQPIILKRLKSVKVFSLFLFIRRNWFMKAIRHFLTIRVDDKHRLSMHNAQCIIGSAKKRRQLEQLINNLNNNLLFNTNIHKLITNYFYN